MTMRMMLLAGAAALWWAGTANAATLIGVVGDRTLVQFDSAAPNTVQRSVTVTGMGEERIRGIDTRPANGDLFAIGSGGNIYTIDRSSGAATRITTVPLTLGDNSQFGFAFNPVPDRIRIQSGTLNLRANPNTGNLVAVDPSLRFADGDVNQGVPVNVSAVAYTNQIEGPVASTIFYAIESQTGSLVIQTPPNDGLLTTVGSLNLGFTIDPGQGASFDIDGITGQAFLLAAPIDGSAQLYALDLTSGNATFISQLLSNSVRELAFGSLGAVAVPEPATLALFGAGLAGMMAVRRRKRA